MLKISSVHTPPRLQQEYESMLAQLAGDQTLARHKDEILAIWNASQFIKRTCISQPVWLKGLFDKNGLHVAYEAKNYIERLKFVFSQANNIEELQQLLRCARAEEFARIAWRDLRRYTTVQQTLNELIIFAQICIGVEFVKPGYGK